MLTLTGLPLWKPLMVTEDGVNYPRETFGCHSESIWNTRKRLGNFYAYIHVHIQGGPKNLAQFLCALTLSNINRFTKLFLYQNQIKICKILSLKILPHLECVATLPCEMSSVLKHIENKTTSVTTHFKKLTTGNNMLVSQLLSKVTVIYPAVFKSNVQYVRLAAGWRIRAGDATDQWRDQWNAATVCPI